MKRRFFAVATLLLAANQAAAQTITGVQPAALDQPRINALLSLTSGGPPLIADLGFGFETFNIQAFFDTGASGVLLSNNTADLLGVTRSTYNGQDVVFSDVGVAGSDNFNVSQPLYVRLARFHPDAWVDDVSDLSEYSQNFGPIRTQIGPIGAEPDPILGDLDVFGVPLMQGKVVVMDPKPVNTFLDTMRTYVYNPGTPYHASTPDSDPGIPTLTDSNSRHIRFSKADFSPYTQVTPAGADGPTLGGNPFIGPDPTRAPQSGDPPPVTISLGSSSVSGSFLLDTGAAASMISKAKALSLGVSYDPQTEGTDNPVLLYNGQPISEQFTLTIGGIGGTTRVAGFFLDSLTLPTIEGLNNPSKNLKFVSAPVLVADITVRNPITNGTLTLDGILGMNYFVASAFVAEAEPFPIIDNLTPGAFDWIVYDDPNNTLGLRISDVQAIGYSTWFGWAGNQWDIGSTASWDLFSTYSDGNAVQFTDFIFNSPAATIFVAQPVAPSAMLFTNNLESQGGVHYTLWGNPITGATGLVKTGNGIVTLQNQNTFTGLTDIQNGTLELAARQNIGPVVVREAGHLIMTTSQNLQGLNLVGGQAVLTAGGNKVLVMRNLLISGNGRLDLNDNRMILDKTTMSIDDLRQMLQAGWAGGTWAGPGVMSGIAAASPILDAIGYADNALLGLSSFAGETVTADSILVRYTWAGDTDLDGDVDNADFGRFFSHFQQTGAFWFDGDFDYDGDVDNADFGLFFNNFNAPPMPLVPLSMESSVPEPATMMLIALCLAGVSSRRSSAARPLRPN